MKLRRFIPACKFSAALFFLIIAVFLTGSIFRGQSYAKTAKELDASADAVMDRFHKQVKDSKDVVKNAKGMLVFPSVKKGALIIGGEYGKGALRVGGKTVDYYRMISGSVGFQIGGQAKDIIKVYKT